MLDIQIFYLLLQYTYLSVRINQRKIRRAFIIQDGKWFSLRWIIVQNRGEKENLFHIL